MSTLCSKAVAEMLGKRHDNFMRDVRKYVDTLGAEAPEYFIEGTYKDGLGKTRAGYQITLKGCEYIAGRLIGVKAEEFKSKYLQMFPEANTESVNSSEPDVVLGYSTEEVAKLLGCSRRTVQRMIQRGDMVTTQVTIMIPTVKTVVTPEELERYQKERAAGC
jgi:Rha family phage regulatory protein